MLVSALSQNAIQPCYKCVMGVAPYGDIALVRIHLAF